MKLLITGPTGFLGKRLAAYYEQRCEVIRVGRSQVELNDAESVDGLIRTIRPDVVIHCAAMADLKDCEADPDKAYQVNVQSAVHVAQACRNYHCKPVFCSSDQVYFEKKSGKGQAAHNEKEVLEPFPFYGRLKLEMERLCLQANPDSVCLRLTWMYDWTIPEGTDHGDFFRNLRSTVSKGGTLVASSRDYRGITYVKEAVENMERVFALPGGIYNYGSASSGSMLDTVKCLLDALGIFEYPVLDNEGAFEDEPRNICMDGSLAARQGICFTGTAEGLLQCLADMKAGLDIYSCSTPPDICPFGRDLGEILL